MNLSAAEFEHIVTLAVVLGWDVFVLVAAAGACMLLAWIVQQHMKGPDE
jgi:hypothetical protein